MAKTAFIGIDIGTTGARCCIFDGDGRLISMAKRNYRIIQPKPGWVEQDPDEVVSAVYSSIKESLELANGEYEIGAIGLSSVFHSIMLVDSDVRKKTNLIIWGDNRSNDLLKSYRERFDYLYDITGCPLHVNYPLAKLIWFKHETPQALDEAYRIMTIKEYVLWNLAKVFAIDISVASGSGLLNIYKRKWEESIFDSLDISIGKMSETVYPSTVVGKVSKEVSLITSLREGTPIVIGAGDGALSSLGSNSIGEGKMAIMIGTSGAVRMAVKGPMTDKKRRTWCYILDEDTWLVGCAINNAGLVMAWYIDGFYEDLKEMGLDLYREAERWVQEVKPGAGGLLLLPFLTGERGPYWNADVRGILFGLALHHDRRHIARAIIEGVAFRMRSIYEAVSEVVSVPTELRGTGGLMRSKVWAGVLSSVLGRSIVRVNMEEASSFGAAVMAMRGVGYIKSYEDILPKAVQLVDCIEPDERLRVLYERLYRIYWKIYHKLQDEFREISELQETMG